VPVRVKLQATADASVPIRSDPLGTFAAFALAVDCMGVFGIATVQSRTSTARLEAHPM